MSKIDDFKLFIRNNPKIYKSVINKKTTWQELFELYDIYGENNEIWDDYNETKDGFNLNKILNNLKNINSETLESNIDNLQRATKFLEDITSVFITTPKKEKRKVKKDNFSTIEKLYDD